MNPPPEQFPKFESPEEELRYLRERATMLEAAQAHVEQPATPEVAISRAIHEYAKQAPAASPEKHIESDPVFEQAVGVLTSSEHRDKMREVHAVLSTQGILPAIAATRKMGNPHFEDDFHRVLVEYVKQGGTVIGLDKERVLMRALHVRVYEVLLPSSQLGTEGGVQPRAEELRQLAGIMEQFYHGFLGAGGKDAAQDVGVFMELVQSNFSQDIVFFVGVPEHLTELFLKQLLAVFPNARVELRTDDYNVFNVYGASVASFASVSNHYLGESLSKKNATLPLKPPTAFEEDPIKVLIQAFTKIDRDGEGAAIQMYFLPQEDQFASKLRTAKDEIMKGKKKPKEALDLPLTVMGSLARGFGELFAEPKKKDAPPPDVDPKLIERIDDKLSRPIMRVGVRLVASAGDQSRATAILSHLESAFTQFNDAQGGRIKFIHPDKSRTEKLLYNFTYRLTDEDEVIHLNTQELATLYHFPSSVHAKAVPQLKQSSAATAPAPSDFASDGLLLGINKHQGSEMVVRFGKKDRVRHMYVIGQTGTGKTVFLKNMVIEDIKNGEGVCFIDPHGTDVQDILAAVPKERINDVIYFDPSYAPRPFGLNMLEYDESNPQQKIFVVNELLSIFRKLYEAVPESMGPAFEQYFRNATMLVMDDVASGNTLLEISRVLADAKFRELKLSRCKNPIVVQFWRDIAAKSTGEASLANMVPYITNKFDVFLSNDIMRPIIAQEKSSFNFRDIMDNRKIFLVNLAKGKLGEINAHLIGLILVGKLLMAALSRVDSYGKELPPFYTYIDEFQNVTTDSISAILSEARKYGLSLTIAHQFIGQLEEGIKNAVFGNVGSLATFRVGAEDAEFLEKQFAPTFNAKDIMTIDNYNAYLKMLVNGIPKPPFNMKTYPPVAGDPQQVENLKSLSYLKFGKDRRSVDEVILQKYAAASYAANNPPKAAPAPRPVTQPVAPQPVPMSAPLQPTPVPVQQAPVFVVQEPQPTQAPTVPPVVATPGVVAPVQTYTPPVVQPAPVVSLEPQAALPPTDNSQQPQNPTAVS